MKTNDPFSMDISRHIWETRYRAAGEPDIRASWRRVAQAIAQAETNRREQWTERFATLLDDFRFLPGGGGGGPRLATDVSRPGRRTYGESARAVAAHPARRLRHRRAWRVVAVDGVGEQHARLG